MMRLLKFNIIIYVLYTVPNFSWYWCASWARCWIRLLSTQEKYEHYTEKWLDYYLILFITVQVLIIPIMVYQPHATWSCSIYLRSPFFYIHHSPIQRNLYHLTSVSKLVCQRYSAKQKFLKSLIHVMFWRAYQVVYT